MKAKLKSEPTVILELTFQEARALEHSIGESSRYQRAQVLGPVAADVLGEMWDEIHRVLYEQMSDEAVEEAENAI